MKKNITKIAFFLLISFAFLTNISLNTARADWSTSLFGGFGTLFDMSPDGNYIYSVIAPFGNDTTGKALLYYSPLNLTVKFDTLTVNYDRTLSWVKVTPDGNSIVLAFDYGKIDVWNLVKKTRTASISKFKDSTVQYRATQYAISDDSKELTCMLLGDTIRIKKWSLETGQSNSEFLITEDMRNTNVALSQNGKYFTLINSASQMKGWDLSSQKQTFSVPESPNFLSILNMAISNNGNYIAFNDNNPKFQVYNVATNKFLPFYSYEGYPNSVFQFNDTNHIMVDSKSDLIIYDCTLGQAQKLAGLVENIYKATVQHVPLTSNLDKGIFYFQKLLSCTATNISLSYMRILDMKNYKYIATIPNVHLNSITGTSLSKDGNIAMSQDLDSLVNVWDVATGNLLGQFHNGDRTIFTPADHNILEVNGTIINIFDYTKDSVLSTWTTNHGNIINLVCDTSNNVIAETNDYLLFMSYPDGVVKNAVAKNIPGKYLLKMSGDNKQLFAVDSLFTVYKYDIGTGNLNSSTNMDSARTSSMSALDITPDGKFLATIYQMGFPTTTGKTFLWDISTGHTVNIINKPALDLKFSHDSWKYWVYLSDQSSAVYNIYTNKSSCSKSYFRNPLDANNSNIIVSNDGLHLLMGECSGRVSYFSLCEAFVPVPWDGQPGSPDNPTNGNLTVSPNPSSDFITLNYLNIGTTDKIQIFSIEGIKVLESNYTDNLDVSSLAPGFYFVKVGNQVSKFVKY
ncbi:MAG: T9SS type A sorting domain-containing protein [FCB group bacterium]